MATQLNNKITIALSEKEAECVRHALMCYHEAIKEAQNEGNVQDIPEDEEETKAMCLDLEKTFLLGRARKQEIDEVLADWMGNPRPRSKSTTRRFDKSRGQ